MNQDEYIEKRADDQITWYDRKSQTNQKAFNWLRVVEIVAAASISLLAGYSDTVLALKFVVGALGLLIAVPASVLSLYRFQENWTGYPITCESLKQHEKHPFLTRAESYNGDDPFPPFVQRVESLISREHSNWAQYMRAGGKEKSHG